MIITIASFKGGQAKTTTAVHLAAHLQLDKPTLLIDGDPNRSATAWSRRKGFPFKVIDERQAARFSRDFEHIVIDTQARPSVDELKALADGCDQLIIPLTPDALSLDTLFLITDALKTFGGCRFQILLTIVPPKPSKDGEEIRAHLDDAKIPVFSPVIRRYKVFQKAALDGVLVNQIDDEHAIDGWNDYGAVAKILLT